MNLNVLAIADEIAPKLYDHLDRERWQEIDLVVSSGDLPPDFLDYLCTNLNIPLFYVRGNHDASYPESNYDGSQDVNARIVTYRGLRIAGFEGSRRYNRGACQYTEREMNKRSRRVRLQSVLTGPPHLVLTHAPPAGCHDALDPCHRGFECFNDLLGTWRPQYFVHGHDH